MTDRKAFEEGLILGLVSFPFNSKPEPTAYSYNGTESDSDESNE
jgi:hypothetical protein